MTLREPVRRRLRASCGTALVLGAGMLAAGLWLQHADHDVTPVPIRSGLTVAWPDPGPFGSRIALYGVSSTAQWPTANDLGCRLDGATSGARLVGRQAGPAVGGTSGPATLDRRVINGVAVLPLLEVVPAARGSLTCDSLADVTPAYVVRTSGVQNLAPMAAFSFASLAVVVGAGGVLTLRPEES